VTTTRDAATSAAFVSPRRQLHRREKRLAAWAVAQYPYVLLPELTIGEAAGGRATLVAMLVVLLTGSVILVPALVHLFMLFQRPRSQTPGAEVPRRSSAAG
jgi:hypothetical protein